MVFQQSPAKTLVKWIGNTLRDVGEHRVDLAIKSSFVFVLSDRDIGTGLLTLKTCTQRGLQFWSRHFSLAHVVPKHSDMWKPLSDAPWGINCILLSCSGYNLPVSSQEWDLANYKVLVCTQPRVPKANDLSLPIVNKLTPHWGLCIRVLILMLQYHPDSNMFKSCHCSKNTVRKMGHIKSCFGWRGICR